MSSSIVVSPAYRAAVAELQAACLGCRCMAEVLDSFAGQLRGGWADPDGPSCWGKVGVWPDRFPKNFIPGRGEMPFEKSLRPHLALTSLRAVIPAARP
jgi:hypothetical protein